MILRFIRDLFKGPANAYWDLARIGSTIAVLAMLAGQGWNIYLGLPIELGPTGLGGGLAAVLTASAGFVWAKDRGTVVPPAGQGGGQ